MTKKKQKKGKSFLNGIFAKLVFIFFILLLSSAVLAMAGYSKIKNDIPKINEIADYKPKQGTKVYSYDGELIAEFCDNNKRNIVPYDKIPENVKHAFVAAEDAHFFEHFGINPMGIARAFIKNIVSGRKKQGASTITQQLAKGFVGREKTYTRKIKEALLSLQLEKKLSKEEILYLYLNEIYLGSGAYGVETAARTYFSKHIWELSLSEIATIAGLPPAPSRYSPLLNPKSATERRNYVLRRMYEEKYITKEDMEKALSETITTNPEKELFLDKAPYFSEKVRRYLIKKYGMNKLYEEGLTVYTTTDMRATEYAHKAIFKGLREHEKNQGYSGPLYHINLKKDLDKYLKKHEKAFGKITADSMIRGHYYQGVVTKTEADKAYVRVGEVERPIYIEDLSWARPYGNGWVNIKSTDQIFKPGDIVLVHPTDKKGTTDENDHRNFDKPLPKNFYFALDQMPTTQAAIIVKDPYSGYIKAIMGGSDFEESEFDRTQQACRQPGSAIKPVFYSIALENKKFTAASTLLDAPIASSDFTPMNSHENFEGEVTLWRALVNSMNTPSVRLLQEVGVNTAIAQAKKLGIKSAIKAELGSVLGSSCLTVDELTDAYSHFANEGKAPHTEYIRKIYDIHGNLLEDNTVFYDSFATGAEKISRMAKYAKRKEKQGMSKQTAYIMTKIMQDVIRYGTGRRASSIERAIAGKTGTTNDYLDAWFIGFSPEIVAGVWVGKDDYGKTLGIGGDGSRAALPIWKDFMENYLANFPESNFTAPPGIVSRKVDTHTGLLSNEGVIMYFKAGTEPTKTKADQQIKDPSKIVDEGIF